MILPGALIEIYSIMKAVSGTSEIYGGAQNIIGRREVFYQRCINISIYFGLALLAERS